MKISKELTQFIEDNIKLLEDRTQHRELFYELLFGDYHTEEAVREFFKLIEELKDTDLNNSVKEHVLDIIVEEINERRDYTTSHYSEYDDTYYYSPSVSKDELVKWVAICGVDNIVDFIASMGDDVNPYLRILVLSGIEMGSGEGWDVDASIILLEDYDPVHSQDHFYSYRDKDDAKKMAYNLSENPQQLFEDILDNEYVREHNTLTDLDRFI